MLRVNMLDPRYVLPMTAYVDASVLYRMNERLDAEAAADRLATEERREEHRLRVSRERNTLVGKVYFAEAMGTDRIKIGWTRDVTRRLESLRCGCPVRLVLLGTMAGTLAEEYRLHRLFRALRSDGGSEWFHATAELRAFIAEHVR